MFLFSFLLDGIIVNIVNPRNFVNSAQESLKSEPAKDLENEFSPKVDNQ